MIYTEVPVAATDPTLNLKVRVACIIAAEGVFTEAQATVNHVNRLLWAKATMIDPVTAGNRMMWAVLSQNMATPLANVLIASDAAVQTAVNLAVDLFANGS